MRSRTVSLFLLATIAVAVFASTTSAFVPSQVSYQGRLTDANGLPLTDTLSIKFSIYNSSGGGIALWTETQPAVPVIGGIFNVFLGAVTPLDQSVFNINTVIDRFLGIGVGGAADLQPLQKIVAVPYAFRVQTVDDASGGHITSAVNIGDNNTLTNGIFVAGFENSATGSQSVAVGGSGNIANGSVASVFGGSGNTASGDHSNASGESNTAGGDWSVVGGGSGNNATGRYATIGGGEGNTADTVGATVGGGQDNTASQSNAVVAGGSGNSATGDRAAVLGGTANLANGDWSGIGGGFGNMTTGLMSVVSGGNENKAIGDFSFVGGGGGSASFGIADSDSNVALGNYSAVVGGRSQIASGEGAFVGGGNNNNSSGLNATIPGGAENTATGGHSFAAGLRAKALHAGSFVWGDTQAGDFASTASNQFLIRSLGGVGVGTNNPRAPLHIQEGSTGVTPNGSSVAVFERNDFCYVSLLSPTDRERGLLFGDASNSVDGVIMYNNTALRRGLQFRTGGNATRMAIDSLGNVGIGDNTPDSKLDVAGSVATDVEVVTSGLTLDGTHSVIIFEMPQITGAHFVFLPLASTCPGRVYTFKVSAANNDDILLQRQGADLIDNSTFYNIVTDLDFVQLVSDGISHWYIISER